MKKWGISVTFIGLIFILSGCLFATETTSDVDTNPNGEIPEIEDIEDQEADKEVLNYIPATVTRVVDGDTAEVKLENGKTEKLRLLLVDTPESVHPQIPEPQPYALEASDYAKKTLTGKEVELHIDVSERDKYGRLLVYLHVDGKDFNKSLIEKGYARVAYVWEPNTTRADEYYAAQKEAQEKGLGIWSIENYAQEDGFKTESKQEEHVKEEEKKKEVKKEESNNTSAYTGPYDPFGEDRNCSDFSSHQEAQAFFIAAGGPEKDPHRLDGNDKDGLACENL